VGRMEAPGRPAAIAVYASMAFREIQADDAPELRSGDDRRRNIRAVLRGADIRVFDLDVQHRGFVEPKSAGVENVVRSCDDPARVREFGNTNLDASRADRRELRLVGPHDNPLRREAFVLEGADDVETTSA